MAEVTLASDSERQIWSAKYLSEYVRMSGFAPYMTREETAIIRIRGELQNERGKIINFPLITRLKGSGVTGSQVLDGAEEDLGNYSAQVVVDWLRNGVRVPKSTSYLSEIDLWGAAKANLRQWSAETLRDNIIQSLGQIVIPGANSGVHDTYVNYASATAGQRNTYSTNNKDRILFGAATSNWSGTFATGLANVDSTNDKLSTSIGSLAKRMAQLAGGYGVGANLVGTGVHIRPYQDPRFDREYYVMFCEPYSFRDLKADTAMINANRDARAREGSSMDKNPLFQDGDLLYDGVIYRQVPELAALRIIGAGASSIDVGQNFLCGQSAVAVAWGQQPTPRTDLLKDFQFRPGVAIEELRGQNKVSFNGVQYGMVSVFTSSVSD